MGVCQAGAQVPSRNAAAAATAFWSSWYWPRGAVKFCLKRQKLGPSSSSPSPATPEVSCLKFSAKLSSSRSGKLLSLLFEGLRGGSVRIGGIELTEVASGLFIAMGAMKDLTMDGNSTDSRLPRGEGRTVASIPSNPVFRK